MVGGLCCARWLVCGMISFASIALDGLHPSALKAGFYICCLASSARLHFGFLSTWLPAHMHYKTVDTVRYRGEECTGYMH